LFPAKADEVMSLSGKVIARQELGNPVVGFQHILVATDFSQEARSALNFALGIARSFQSQVYLVHVISTGFLQYVSPERAEDVTRQAAQFAGQEMQRLLKEAGCEGKVQETLLSGAAVWPLLEEFIRDHKIDLLVLGRHGHIRTKWRLLGPVAEEIFRLAECPVLTVGTPKEQPSLPRGFRQILLATNFKPPAEYAAHFAYALERGLKAHMNVLHVVEDQRELPDGGRDIVSEFMVTRMKKGMPLSCAGRCEPKFQVRFGDAGEQILKSASEEQSDLIVLGMRSGKDVAGKLPSAIAYKVACQAGCPVLTIRR
jgi:nucleotide-binding universal stress UspA family protein